MGQTLLRQTLLTGSFAWMKMTGLAHSSQQKIKLPTENKDHIF